MFHGYFLDVQKVRIFVNIFAFFIIRLMIIRTAKYIKPQILFFVSYMVFLFTLDQHFLS